MAGGPARAAAGGGVRRHPRDDRSCSRLAPGSHQRALDAPRGRGSTTGRTRGTPWSARCGGDRARRGRRRDRARLLRPPARTWREGRRRRPRAADRVRRLGAARRPGAARHRGGRLYGRGGLAPLAAVLDGSCPCRAGAPRRSPTAAVPHAAGRGRTPWSARRAGRAARPDLGARGPRRVMDPARRRHRPRRAAAPAWSARWREETGLAARGRRAARRPRRALRGDGAVRPLRGLPRSSARLPPRRSPTASRRRRGRRHDRRGAGCRSRDRRRKPPRCSTSSVRRSRPPPVNSAGASPTSATDHPGGARCPPADRRDRRPGETITSPDAARALAPPRDPEMSEPLTDALARVRALLLDPEGLVRAVAAGRRRGSQPPWRRVELRPVDLKAGRQLQVTTYDERRRTPPTTPPAIRRPRRRRRPARPAVRQLARRHRRRRPSSSG